MRRVDTVRSNGHASYCTVAWVLGAMRYLNSCNNSREGSRRTTKPLVALLCNRGMDKGKRVARTAITTMITTRATAMIELLPLQMLPSPPLLLQVLLLYCIFAAINTTIEPQLSILRLPTNAIDHKLFTLQACSTTDKWV